MMKNNVIEFIKKGKSLSHKKPYDSGFILNWIYFVRDVFWSTRYYLKYIHSKKEYLKKLKSIKNSKKGKCAFVLANGPSLSELSLEKVLKLQESGYDVFAVNSFISKQNILIPNYYVLSDPLYFKNLEELRDDLKIRLGRDLSLLNSKNVMCFVPFEFDVSSALNNYCYFNDAECLMFKNYSDPSKPRSFSSMTAYKALMISVYMGYEKIFISGFDNNYFLGLENDEHNKVTINEYHFYKKDIALIKHKITDMGFNKIYEVLLDGYWLFYFLDKFKKFNIINLDKEGLSDSFSKNHDLDVYKE